MRFESISATRNSCSDCPLRMRNFCQATSQILKDTPYNCAPRLRQFSAETTLQEENGRPKLTGILRSGYLRTERILQDGRRSVLGFFAPGDLVGDLAGSTAGPALISATNAEVCAFESTNLSRAMQHDATLNAALLGEAMKQHTRQLEMVWRRGALNSRERIVAFMVMAAEFMPTEPLSDGSLILSMKVSRRDWADFANTTVETICRTLRYLADTDMVEAVTPGRFRIRNLGRLADLAGMDTTTDRTAMLMNENMGPSRRAEYGRVPRARGCGRIGADSPFTTISTGDKRRTEEISVSAR